MTRPAEIRARCPLLETGDARRGRVPAEGRPDQPDRHHPGASPGCRASAARGSSRTYQGHRASCVEKGRAVGVETRAGRPVAGRPRRDRRRHVGARARRPRPASTCRCTPPSTSTSSPSRSPGLPPQPAGAARHRRVHLLQGGCRQAAGRLLRAGGQAVGHGRHPRGLLLRDPARGLRAFRADPRAGASRRVPVAGARPASRLFFNGPESFTPDDRYLLGEAPEVRNLFVAAGFNSIGIQSAGRRRQGAGRLDPGRPPADRPAGRRHPPLPCRSRRTAATSSDRTVETLGLLYAMHWPYRQPRPRAACAARPCTTGWRRAARSSARPPAGSAPTGSPRRASSREYATPTAARTGSSTARERAPAPSATRVGLFDQSSFGKFLVAGPRRRRRAQPLSANRRRRAGRAASSTRNGSTSAAASRPTSP